MKNRLLILAFLALFGAADAFAFDYFVNGIYYSLLGGDSVKVTYSVKGDNNSTAYTGSVTIPSTVRLGGVWRRVVWIGDSAFYKCSGLTSITMPNSIKKVGTRSFYYCSSLRSVSLSDSVTSIGQSSFAACTSLTGISLPNSIRRMYPNIFGGCTSLTSITIPDSVKVIENKMFYNCQNLQTVSMPNTITLIDDCAFYHCYYFNPTFPDSLKKIGSYAYYQCAYYSSARGSIVLPDHLDTIEDYAFYGTSYLTSVYLPNSVRYVGRQAFNGCGWDTYGDLQPIFNDKIFAYLPRFYYTSYNKSTYTIPSGITTIASGACYSNSYLNNITIPNSVKYINSQAFNGCNSLSIVNMSDSVEYIGDSAFYYCYKLTTISLPKTLDTIGCRAFYNSNILNRIELHSSTPPSFGSQCFYSVPGNFFVPCDSLVPYQTELAKVSVAPSRVFGNPYSITVTSANQQQGTISMLDQPYTCPDSIAIFQAVEKYGSTFVKWSDGNTTNPRTIRLTGDTTLQAIFKYNKYTISTSSVYGTVSGGGTYDFGTEITLTATPIDHYHFDYWNDGSTNPVLTHTVHNDTTIVATFSIDRFTIVFANYDNSELQRDTLIYGTLPAYRGAIPTRPATAKFTYSFKGWSEVIDYATTNKRYMALYDSVIAKHVISFVNYDNSLLQRDTLNYGLMPAFRGITPTKPSNVRCTYTFKGWNPALSLVTRDTVYVAEYDSTYIPYTITFVNYDSTTLQSTLVNYGTTPTYTSATPAKPATAQYTYTFKGWDPAITAVTGAATYTAQYDSTVNSYVVKFVNYNGTTLQSNTLQYGATPLYSGTTPTHSATAKYTFTFRGWDPEVTIVTGAVTYTAQYDTVIKQYTITFVNYDNTTLQSGPVDYDAMPQYTGATPTKPSTAKYNYTFKGWNPTLAVVTGNKTYKAQYDSVIRQYPIAFVNYNGDTLQFTNVNYNTTPVYSGATPIRQATARYSYTFKKWNPTITKVTGAATYTAQYDSTTNRYTATFVNYNGTTLQTSNMYWGSTPAYSGTTPTKPTTARCTYTFSGWDPALAPIDSNTTYTAQFDSVIRKYTVTFVNYNNASLQSSQVDYDAMPEYTGATPTRPATAQYTFTFSGWTPALSTVTGAATYKAKYDTTINQYSIAFVNYDGTTLQNSSWNYGTTPQYSGQTPSKPANVQYTYTFKGWKPSITSVIGQKVYTADYDSVVNQYNVTFLNYDGATLQSSSFGYGSMPVYSSTVPQKAANVQYTYVFKGWNPALVSVSGVATYTAEFDSVLNQYNVSFVNFDGALLQSGLFNYGATPVYSGATPMKSATAQYTYSFKGWTPAIANVTGAATYTAQYDSVLNLYNVSFVNYDGSSLQSQSYYYGSTPTYLGQTPYRAADAQYTYTFRCWTPAIQTVTGNATYTAVYDSVINNYTISFVNYNGTVLQTGNVNYGDMPQYTGATPSKAATANYTYSFKGWSPAIAPVTAAAIYTATFDSVANQSLITFLNYDGTLLQSGMVNRGTMPTYTGATPSKPATAQYTYTFREWTPSLAIVSGDATYTAVFDSAVNRYTISVIYNTSEGTVTGGGTYDYGTTVTLTATAADHYHFVNWGNAETASVTFLTVTGDSTIRPVFEIDQYTITALSSNETYGTVTGGGNYAHGSVVTLTAVANDHYRFVGWSDGSTTATITFMATANVVLTAQFLPVQHQVTVIANYNSRGTVTGSGTYDYGTTVTVTATPNEGYEFTGWSNGETSTVLSITVVSDTILTANFMPISTDVENVTEVEYIAYTQGKTIYVHGATDQPVYLYDMTGNLVAFEQKASDEVLFDVYADGIYVVLIGNDKKAIRVVVK